MTPIMWRLPQNGTVYWTLSIIQRYKHAATRSQEVITDFPRGDARFYFSSQAGTSTFFSPQPPIQDAPAK
jgi:hypothetical protein